MPASVEENLGTEQNLFRRAIGRIDFQNNSDKDIVSLLCTCRHSPA